MTPGRPSPTLPSRARTLLGPGLRGAVLPLLLLPGCVSPRLVDERCQPPYDRLLSTYEGLERTTQRVEVALPDGSRLGVALEHVRGARGARGIEATHGEAAPTLVLQPGVLADGGTWRFLAGALAGAYELVLVDPPGTGRSDIPEPGPRDSGVYSPTWLAGATLGALEAWERDQGPRASYVLVGHSLGGEVVLRALGDPSLRARHAALLERVRGALLFNPADLTMDERSQRLLDLASVSDLEVGLGEWLGLVMREVRTGVRNNVRDPTRDALRSEALRIEALLGRPGSRHAMQAMLRRFQPLQADGVTLDREAAARLAAHEATIAVPVRVLWGTADTTLPRGQGAALCARLAPGVCRLTPLEGVGHSSHQEGIDRHVGRVRELLAEILARPTPP